MAKRNFDMAIIQNFKTQAADTFPIKMIEIEKIKPHEENFYSMNMEEVKLLAEDIDRQGLRHNLVVCEDEIEKGSYIIISGHRRFAAVSFLVSEGKWKSKYLPCSVSTVKSNSETMMNLIMLNATTRVLSDTELMIQFEKLEKIIKENKELSDMNGRMRDKIASVLKVSPAQIGKMENIKRNASDEVKAAVKTGEISISTANELAKLDEKEQQELINDVGISNISNKLVKEKQSEIAKKDTDYKSSDDYYHSDNKSNNYGGDYAENDSSDESDNFENYAESYSEEILKKEKSGEITDYQTSPVQTKEEKTVNDYSELIKAWSNDNKRRLFTKNYKDWGLWFENKELFLKYYKYELPGGTRIIVMEYVTEKYYPKNDEPKYHTLKNTYIQKDLNCFSPSCVSDFELSDYLKQIKEELIKK